MRLEKEGEKTALSLIEDILAVEKEKVNIYWCARVLYITRLLPFTEEIGTCTTPQARLSSREISCALFWFRERIC